MVQFLDLGNMIWGIPLKISELINKADGLIGDAYLERASNIIRIKPDLSEQLIRVNLKSALDGNLKNDLQLKGSDKVQVYGKMDMVQQKVCFHYWACSKSGAIYFTR